MKSLADAIAYAINARPQTLSDVDAATTAALDWMENMLEDEIRKSKRGCRIELYMAFKKRIKEERG
mgnify:CR=1 FL=1